MYVGGGVEGGGVSTAAAGGNYRAGRLWAGRGCVNAAVKDPGTGQSSNPCPAPHSDLCSQSCNSTFSACSLHPVQVKRLQLRTIYSHIRRARTACAFCVQSVHSVGPVFTTASASAASLPCPCSCHQRK